MTSLPWFRAAALVAAVVAVSPAASAQGDELDPRVLVMPVEGQAPPATLGPLAEDIRSALARGAERMTPTVARAAAPLADTAVIVGCEPAEAACKDAVAAALNVDQLLLAEIAVKGDGVEVLVTAVTREAEPVQRTFPIRAATRAEDLQALEDAVPTLLEAGEARKRDVEPPPPPPPPPDGGAGPTPPPPVASGRSKVPLVVAGAGVVIAAGGGVLWALASAKQGEIDDAPTNTPGDLERLEELEADARLRANLGNVLVGVGAVALVGGVTWYLLGGDDAEEPPVRAAPLVVPGGGGLAIGGAW